MSVSGTVAATQQPEARPVQTIEMTSKRLKAQGCLALIVIAVGVLLTFGAFASDPRNVGLAAVGVPILLVGFVWAVVTKLLMWWKHR
jgi:hypothetical protein